MNNALREAARIYNLTLATGVPPEKISMALVIHGDAISDIYNDQAHKKEFGNENPNTELIKVFKKLGIHLFVCGQNLGYRNIPIENLAPEIEIALSAKTAFIVLDQKGYTYLGTK
jgi:intracellular sulfur oxidation DsrE/DsrF family protein